MNRATYLAQLLISWGVLCCIRLKKIAVKSLKAQGHLNQQMFNFSRKWQNIEHYLELIQNALPQISEKFYFCTISFVGSSNLTMLRYLRSAQSRKPRTPRGWVSETTQCLKLVSCTYHKKIEKIIFTVARQQSSKNSLTMTYGDRHFYWASFTSIQKAAVGSFRLVSQGWQSKISQIFHRLQPHIPTPVT